MIQRSQTRGYSDTTECYYFYATGNEQLSFLRSSAIFCDHMETGRIVFVAILQLGNGEFALRVGLGGGVHIEVQSLTDGNFERNPKRYQDLILWAWLNSLSLPTGTFHDM